MANSLKIGILRETKNPPDRRVPLTPTQVAALREKFPSVQFFVQPCKMRCYADEEYAILNIPLQEDLSECDILMGVKEVDKSTFVAGKTYLFFAHVAKKQSHNQSMFREMSSKNITLVDYEYLTAGKGERVVAFGRWAGIVGAYNGLRAYGIKTDSFSLRPAHECRDLAGMWEVLSLIRLKPGLKILVTGEGRVANGALETLGICNTVKVSPEDFLTRESDFPAVCQIGPQHYTSHREGRMFDFGHFIKHPDEYRSAFLPYTKVTDILVAGHYWDPRSPVLFTKDDMKKTGFRISVIADISCDVNGSVPSTLRATTIADPYYGYNPFLDNEEPAFQNSSDITVMAIDNLPGELPRDASSDFGLQLMKSALPDLLTGNKSPMIDRATILKNGKLTSCFLYLDDYLK